MPRATATLYLSILLSERFGSQVSTETGRWASFRGSLENPQGGLNGTAFFLEVFEGDYTQKMKMQRERYASLLDQQPAGPEIPESSIGVVNVTPHAQPSDFSEAPFRSMVHLARSDFMAALHLIDVTFSTGQLVSATLAVRSDQFDPEIVRKWYPELPIQGFDLSGGFQGFIFEFRVNRTLVQRIPPERHPVRLPEKTYLRKPTAAISIIVNSSYNRYSMPSGYVEVLSCAGLISGGGDDPLKGAECSITFHEYDLGEDGCYPNAHRTTDFATVLRKDMDFVKRFAGANVRDLEHREGGEDHHLKARRKSKRHLDHRGPPRWSPDSIEPSVSVMEAPRTAWRSPPASRRLGRAGPFGPSIRDEEEALPMTLTHVNAPTRFVEANERGAHGSE